MSRVWIARLFYINCFLHCGCCAYIHICLNDVLSGSPWERSHDFDFEPDWGDSSTSSGAEDATEYNDIPEAEPTSGPRVRLLSRYVCMRSAVNEFVCIRESRQLDLSGRLVPTCATMLLVCMQVLTINPWLVLRQEKRPRATLVPNTRACRCIETRCHHLPFNHRATCASTLPSTLGKNRPRWMAGVVSEPPVRWEKPLLCPYGRHFPGANAHSSGDLVRRCVPSCSPSLRIFVVMLFLFVRNIAGGLGIFHTKIKK